MYVYVIFVKSILIRVISTWSIEISATARSSHHFCGLVLDIDLRIVQIVLRSNLAMVAVEI